ncbi:MAG: hypothetical protein HKP57_09570 [Halobacteria archaeon]|nr:hypothetical protein [Halobacteria archaeon]
MLAVSNLPRILLAVLVTSLLTLAIPTGSALAKQSHSDKHAKQSHHVKHAKLSHRGKHTKRSKRGKYARLFHRGKHNQHEVCKDLKGGTRGLFGLCVVYCEAQSCDAESAAAGLCTRQRFNERVLENYNRKRATGDPEMPCLVVPDSASPCPCLTDQEATDTQWSSCDIDDGVTRVSGIQGEELSVDTAMSTCELEGLYYGADSRFSVLDGPQLSACSAMIESATDLDGISCGDTPDEEIDNNF